MRILKCKKKSNSYFPLCKNIDCTVVVKFTDNIQETHFENKDGFKYRKIYKNNSLIYYEDSSGLILKKSEHDVYESDTKSSSCDETEPYESFDERGNLVCVKTSSGLIKRMEYDKHNNCIHYIENDGYEEWFEYDNKNRLIHLKNSNFYEEWYEYNRSGNTVLIMNSLGCVDFYNIEDFKKEWGIK